MDQYYKKINCIVNNKEILKNLLLSNEIINSKVTNSNNYIKVIKDINLEKKILKLLRFEDLPIREIVLVSIPKNSSSLIHTDGTLRKLSLLIPITNCKKILFNWWKPIDNEKIKIVNFPCKHNQIEPISIVDKKSSHLLDYTYIDQPTIINIKNFHNIENTSADDSLEILLSIRIINEDESFENIINSVKER